MEENKNIHMKDFVDQEEEEDFEYSNYNGNQEDTDFDNVVGCLQEVVISEEFENLQQKFFKQHYNVFEDTDENKMEYMTIFKNYQKTIEHYIEEKLAEMIENFEMKDFLEVLPDRQEEIDEQLMDLLFSFADFEQFKALVLDYKKDFEEQERIERLKTIKQTAKKTLNKANQQMSKGSNNIFSDNKTANLFQKQSDPIQDLKNLKISNNNQKKQQQIQDIKEEDLQRSFFIDCRQLATPQIQKKK